MTDVLPVCVGGVEWGGVVYLRQEGLRWWIVFVHSFIRVCVCVCVRVCVCKYVI